MKEKSPLSVTHPQLAAEAVGWNPSEYLAGSSKKVLWRCSLGHEWDSIIANRTKGSGCPVCAGQKVLSGFNDLVTKFPEVANEADGWDPTTVMPGSHQILAWKCSAGHQWEAQVKSRALNASGCPYCSGLKAQSGVNDLATTHPVLAKQADGWDPTIISSGSSKKMKWLCALGHSWQATISSRAGTDSRQALGCPICSGQKVLAGFNDLATTHPEIAKQAVGWDPTKVSRGNSDKKSWRCEIGHEWQAVTSSRTQGTGCPKCSGRTAEQGESDLATTHPELAKQAVGWDPTQFRAGSSNENLLWRCELGHEWKAKIAARTSRKSGCPTCVNKIIKTGFNDLATTHPDLAKQADGWDPTTVTAGMAKKLKWICDKGHKWEATLNNRSSSVNDLEETLCPICTGKKLLSGFNDLATTHPEIAKQAVGWDPSKVSAGSHEKLKWKCDKGHEFLSVVGNRTHRNDYCPYCSNSLVLRGFNDLATTHPEIAKQAVGWDPTKYLGGTNKKLKWKCEEGHEWLASANGRTQGNGCPKCAKYGFNPGNDGWLYFLRHSQWELLQIGITNNPDVRIKKHKSKGWELIEIRGPMDGQLTRDWETSILQMLGNNGAILAPENVAGKFDGYTESWIAKSFPTKSLRELMDRVQNDESNQ
jgi:hypothetical protein